MVVATLHGTGAGNGSLVGGKNHGVVIDITILTYLLLLSYYSPGVIESPDLQNLKEFSV